MRERFHLMISFFYREFIWDNANWIWTKLISRLYISALLVKFIVPNITELQDDVLDQGNYCNISVSSDDLYNNYNFV